jgi:gamma-glutamyltranspeptidase/glutathione hydrolase
LRHHIDNQRSKSCLPRRAQRTFRRHIEHFPLSFWPRTARPGVLVVEGRLPKTTIDELKRRGHKIEVGPDWSEGRLTAAAQEGPYRRAAANARGMQGYAAGR